MTVINIQGMSVCSSEDALSETLDIAVCPLDLSVIPVAIRRRSSLPTRLAINAAMGACKMAGVDPAATPTVFASVGGEMVITDQLCIELTKPTVHISPTQFHNSVHNTAAAYWSIITGCQRASTAIAAGELTIAMTITDAWSRLTTQGGNLLMVCYEECWPEYIDNGNGQHAIAFALMLSAEANHKTIAQCADLRVVDQPGHVETKLKNQIDRVPVLALARLFQVLTIPGTYIAVPLSFQSRYWVVDVVVSKPDKVAL